jgi:hypothetical protein
LTNISISKAVTEHHGPVLGTPASCPIHASIIVDPETKYFEFVFDFPQPFKKMPG